MYTFEELMSPVWRSDIIYDESFTMVKEEKVAEASFLFDVDTVFSVTSADKTKVYEEGRDYIIKDNKLILTENSRIFCFDKSEVLMEKELPGMCFPAENGKFSLFSEGHYFHDRQIAVTYKKKSSNISIEPEYCADILPKFIQKLKDKEPASVVLYGDSISEGSNSSGVTLTTPFLPKWGNLLIENIKRHYDTKISFYNPSVGGMATHWAIDNAKNLVAEKHPDLAIIAFGMNDRCEKEEFASRIQKIMDIVRETSPETEFILCATTLPNRILPGFWSHQEEYYDALLTLKTKGVAIANFGGMHSEFMKRKRFIDMTGNNVNHPNDFLIRCHAQYISDMLIER